MIVGHQSAILYHQLEIDGAHGVVAKWQGKGLQNPHHGFKSRRRLKKKSESDNPLFFSLQLRGCYGNHPACNAQACISIS
jgi:hypothetical protein